MRDDKDTALLEQLSSERVAAAWNEFLDRYSPLMMHVIRRHGLGEESASECFVHVCAALSAVTVRSGSHGITCGHTRRSHAPAKVSI
jgi:hypothetical protein